MSIRPRRLRRPAGPLPGLPGAREVAGPLVRALTAARRAAASVGGGLREALVMLAAYGLYNLVRGVWGGTLAEGRANAAGVIALEERLAIDVEVGWQAYFLRHDLGMPFWNLFYVASQVVVLPLTVFLVYRYRRPAYAFVRNLVLISWSAGLVWYALQPVAPPRLLAGERYVDTVSAQTVINLDSPLIEAFYNPVAAMPSLHAGMAPIVAWVMVRLTPWLWLKAVGWTYPVLITVCVVVTGNHFLLDVAGGLAIVAPAAGLAWLLSRPPGGVGAAASPPRRRSPTPPRSRPPAGR